jgi:hypothetical protein
MIYSKQRLIIQFLSPRRSHLATMFAFPRLALSKPESNSLPQCGSVYSGLDRRFPLFFSTPKVCSLELTMLNP